MQNKGWVSVGVDHETASLAVETLAVVVPDGAIRLSAGNERAITADCGGSNSYRSQAGTATTGNWN